MASVVFHAFHQIRKTGKLNLFRSHRSEFEDGEQLRDFIYVQDVVKVIFWMMQNRPSGNIFNLGTGKARTFLDLGKAVFSAMEKEPQISFIDIPEDIRASYQYYTESDMSRLKKAGYVDDFQSLESGVDNYVKNYLNASLGF